MKKLDLDKIKEYCKDGHLKNAFLRQLELIQLVDRNYEHIQQLETLQMILAGGLSSYYKEYHKEQEFLTIQASMLAQNTFRNHYTKEDNERLIGVDEVYSMIANGESSIPSFKNHYRRLSK